MAAFDWIKFLCLKNTLHSVDVSSSPNLPPLFITVFWGETNRSSLLQMFLKIGVLESFANFIKHCLSIFLIKLQAWRSAMLLKEARTQVLSCKICNIFMNTIFYRTPPVAASD